MTKANMPPLPADDPARKLVVATPDGSHHITLAGDIYSFLVTGAQTAGRYCLIDMLIPPGGGPPPHRHDFEEMFTLLSGELEFTFRGVPTTVAAPATVAIPANAPHFFRNISSSMVHMLCLCAPAGQEEFFAKIEMVVSDRTTIPPQMNETERAQNRALAETLAPQFRTEFLER